METQNPLLLIYRTGKLGAEWGTKLDDNSDVYNYSAIPMMNVHVWCCTAS